MDLELNKKTVKRILLLIIFAILLYWSVHNVPALGKAISWFLSLISHIEKKKETSLHDETVSPQMEN